MSFEIGSLLPGKNWDEIKDPDIAIAMDLLKQGVKDNLSPPNQQVYECVPGDYTKELEDRKITLVGHWVDMPIEEIIVYLRSTSAFFDSENNARKLKALQIALREKDLNLVIQTDKKKRDI